MDRLPKDPIILLSFVNTKLRDEFCDIDELCSFYEVTQKELNSVLNAVGYVYNSEKKQYI